MATDKSVQAFGLLGQADRLLRRAEKLVPMDGEQYGQIGAALTAVSSAMGTGPACHTAEMDGSIACAICLNIDNTERTPATTICNGYSVCDSHVALASNPKFDIFRLNGKGTTA